MRKRMGIETPVSSVNTTTNTNSQQNLRDEIITNLITGEYIYDKKTQSINPYLKLEKRKDSPNLPPKTHTDNSEKSQL